MIMHMANESMSCVTIIVGVAHADELSYMFHMTYMKQDGRFAKCPEKGSADRLTVERFISMWFNFAATG